MPFLVRLLVNAAALWVATRVVPGVTFSGGWLPFLGVACVFGVVNAFIRPVAKVLALPLIILTLGIFALCRQRPDAVAHELPLDRSRIGISRQRLLAGFLGRAGRELRQHHPFDGRGRFRSSGLLSRPPFPIHANEPADADRMEPAPIADDAGSPPPPFVRTRRRHRGRRGRGLRCGSPAGRFTRPGSRPTWHSG